MSDITQARAVEIMRVLAECHYEAPIMRDDIMRIGVIARTFEQELRAQSSDVAGVVRFAGAVVTELTAISYAIERRGELGAADVTQLYASFEPLIPLASLG